MSNWTLFTIIIAVCSSLLFLVWVLRLQLYGRIDEQFTSIDPDGLTHYENVRAQTIIDSVHRRNGSLHRYIANDLIPSLRTLIKDKSDFLEKEMIILEITKDIADNVSDEWLSEYYLRTINKNTRGTHSTTASRRLLAKELADAVLSGMEY